jgi:cell volume regulation protein A
MTAELLHHALNTVEQLSSVGSSDSTVQLGLVDQVGLILLIGVVSARIAKAFKIPIIIPLLLTGILIGPAGLGFIQPEAFGFSLSNLAFFVVPLFLFGEGLNTDLQELRNVSITVFLLVTVGVLITAVGAALFVHFVLRLPWEISMLLGAIVSATDPTVVVPLIEKGSVNKKISTIVKAESALNDPTSIVIFSIILQLIQGAGAPAPADVVTSFLRLFFGGGAIGVLIGVSSLVLLDKFDFREQLNYVSIVIFIVTYAFAEALGTSGIMASVIAGIIVGNEVKHGKFNVLERNEVFYFWDNISFLTQMVIFLLLGLYATRAMFSGMEAVMSAVVTAALIFVIRPAAVAVSTVFEKINNRERAFISWIGARGAVPAALASQVVGYSVGIAVLSTYADTVFSIVLFTVVATVLLVGFTSGPLAKKLRVEGVDELEDYRMARAKQQAIMKALEKLEDERAKGYLTEDVYQKLQEELMEKARAYSVKLRETEQTLFSPEFKDAQALREKRDLILTEINTLGELRRSGELGERSYRGLMSELLQELDKVDQNLRKFPSERSKQSG